MQFPRIQKLGAEGLIVLVFPRKCEGLTASFCRRQPQHQKIEEFGSPLQEAEVLLHVLDESKSALIGEPAIIGEPNRRQVIC